MRFKYMYREDDQDNQRYWYHRLSAFHDGGEEFRGIIAWCQEAFGAAAISAPGVRWSHDGMAFYFAEENDALAFRMRWC